MGPAPFNAQADCEPASIDPIKNQIVSMEDENPIAEPMPMSKDEVQVEVEKGQAVLALVSL